MLVHYENCQFPHRPLYDTVGSTEGIIPVQPTKYCVGKMPVGQLVFRPKCVQPIVHSWKTVVTAKVNS